MTETNDQTEQESTQPADETAAPEEGAAAKPKKTTRRRPTKKAQAEQAEASGTADETPEEEKPAKAPRKRTTRKKAVEKPAGTEEEQTGQAAAEAEKPEQDEPAEKPKRTTRRRTVKAAKADQDAESSAAVQTADESAAAADAATADEEAPKPKKTTRRRTTKKAQAEQAKQQEEAPAVEGDSDAAAPVQADAAPGEAPGAAEEKASGEAAAEDAAEKPAEGGADESGEAKDQDAHAGNGKRRNRRNRRNRNNNKRREIVPSATRDELASLEDEELIAKATELEVDPTEYGERDDLVSAVYDALLQSEGFVMVEGILDLLPDGYGFIRTDGYLPGEHDVYVGMSTVRRNGLRKGDYITGRVRPPRENEKYPALNTIVTLNDEPFEGPTHRVKFANLTPVFPDERLVMEHGRDTLTARAIDLVSPIGKGQRGLIVSPPKAGKTTVLKDIAAAISANNPEVHLMCLLVDERPEEVTDMERSIDGEVISSTFDMPSENHIAVAELVIERAKRLVENGQDVVILLDSITRLARAYNLSQPASGRILSGGVDSTALYPPKRFLGAARNIEFGGSLTILGTALVDTGSKMDEVIFEEFKGTGNMELKLDRSLAEKRIFPAIDPVASSTRKDELLVDEQEAPLVWGLRRLLANMNNTERAMKMLITSLKQTETNREFLIKSARKAAKSANL